MLTKQYSVSIIETRGGYYGLYKKMKETGGIITSKELKDSNISTIYLTRMVKKGDLTRADRGIYIDSNGDYDEYYFFHNRCKVAVFSYVSALYLHQFTDIMPGEMEVTVYKGYNPHCISRNTRIHYVTINVNIIMYKSDHLRMYNYSS